MAVDVHCNNNNNLGVGGAGFSHSASYLGGNLNGHAGLGYNQAVGNFDVSGGYGDVGHGLVDSAFGTDNHVGGIGLSEGELTGHSDVLNGLGGINGLLSDQGAAKEHAANIGIPVGAGMGGAQHDSFVNSVTSGQDVVRGGFHGDIDGLGLLGSGGRHNGHHGHLGYGIQDVDSHVENLEEDVQPVMVHNGGHHHHHSHHHVGHNHDFEPNFNFHYPTYEIPVHGDVVSEKDAKKIGWYFFLNLHLHRYL